MASSNFSVGNNNNFPKFNNIGGPKPKKTNTTGQGPKDSPSVQPQEETMQFTQAPVADGKTDKFSSGNTEVAFEAAPALAKTSPSSIPTEVSGLGNIAGIGSTGISRTSFDGITALNGLNTTSIRTAGGLTLASVSPLQQVDSVRMPTTSISALNGLESTSFVTSSGRVIG